MLTAVFSAVSFGAALAGMHGAEKVYTPVKAAVVDAEDTVLSRMLIRAVAGSEQIAALLEIESCDADDAYSGLENGKYVAVIELPENFLGDILVGAENHGHITLSAAAAAYGEIVESVASFGELLLAAGQYAVFSGERLMSRYGTEAAFREAFLNEVNATLLTEAMGADSSYFVLAVTDYAGTGLSLPAHYAVSWLAAVLMLCAVMFEKLYTTDRNRAMLLRLRASGVSDGAFLIWKIVLPFVFFAVVLLLALLILGRWLEVVWNLRSIFCAVLGVAVVSVSAAAAMIGARRGTSILLFGTLLSLFLCGGLVPRQMLGQWIMLAGDLTPLGAARGLLAPMLGGAVAPVVLIGAAAWLIICPVISLLRLRAERGGREV